MTISSDQIKELHEKTEYERWSLTRLAELSGDIDLEKYTVETLTNRSHDREITPEGERIAYLRSDGSIGGRGIDQVISDIRPLIFISSYKCLDLFFEWFLKVNGESPTASNRWTFDSKTERVDSINFGENSTTPSILESNTQILEGMANIYTELEDHRHSIIHDMNFEVNDSTLITRDDSGNSYVFENKELFSFAGVVSVCIDAIITDTYDYVTERQLATTLDNLANIHNLPTFDLTNHESSILRVPMEPIDLDSYRWEPPVEIINEIAPVDESGDFWLNLVGFHNDTIVTEWMIPGDEVLELLESGFDISSGDFQEFVVQSMN